MGIGRTGQMGCYHGWMVGEVVVVVRLPEGCYLLADSGLVSL